MTTGAAAADVPVADGVALRVRLGAWAGEEPDGEADEPTGDDVSPAATRVARVGQGDLGAPGVGEGVAHQPGGAEPDADRGGREQRPEGDECRVGCARVDPAVPSANARLTPAQR